MLVAFLSSPSSARWIFMWLLILAVLREAYSHWLHLKLDWKWTECLDHVFINILFSVELDHILYSGQCFNLSPVEKTQASDLSVRNQLCVSQLSQSCLTTITVHLQDEHRALAHITISSRRCPGRAASSVRSPWSRRPCCCCCCCCCCRPSPRWQRGWSAPQRQRRSPGLGAEIKN